ncbi:MAG TPA: LCP family protein [Acidimicrobiia bacterium]|nr:LCP family protein [Acidimicrobiia bacterium]
MRRSRLPLRRFAGGLRWLLMVFVVVAGLGGVYVLFEAATLHSAWASIERVSLNLSPSSEAPLPDTSTTVISNGKTDTTSATGGEANSSSTTIVASTATSGEQDSTATSGEQDSTATTIAEPDPTTSSLQESDPTILEQAAEPPSVIALIGSDSRSGLDDLDDFGDFSGQRADVIVLAVRSGDAATLVSIPRDLYVENTCRAGRHRIGEAFQGCGDRHGLAHLVAELHNLTDLPIEHAIAVDLAGFQSVVDALGGYEICADHALRDTKSGLELDAGCHQVGGETALAWLRSRHTEERVDGIWLPASRGSDLVRNERQRQFLIDMFHRLADKSGPGAILDALKAAAPHLTIDDQLAMSDAAAWLWEFRRADVDTLEIPVTGRTTSGGAAVLEPTVDVDEFVPDRVS